MKTYRVGVIGLGRMGSYIDDQFRDSPLMVLPFSHRGLHRGQRPP